MLRQAANIQWRHSTTGTTALIAASLGGNSRAVYLLLQHGADPNEPLNASGIGPLLAAAMKDHPSCAHALLMAGADLTVSSPYFGTASILATKKGHGRTLAVLQRPQLCLAHQRLAFATAMTIALPTSVRHGREKNSSATNCLHDAMPFDLPYDVLVQVVELLPGFPSTYLFAAQVVTEAAVRHRFSRRRRHRSSNPLQSASRGRTDVDIVRESGSEFCGSLGREQFLATRTSTMDSDFAPGFVFNLGSDRMDGATRTSGHSKSDGSEAKHSLVLEFEVPTPAAFRDVIELYYSCVAPEKDAAAKGAEAVLLASRQQQKLLRQHAPTLSIDGAQQFAFRQIFKLLQRKYRRDPLALWRASQTREATSTGDAKGTPGAVAVTAAVEERKRTAKAAAEESQAGAEYAAIERQLAIVQQQIKQLD